jgi:hypothetical protein
MGCWPAADSTQLAMTAAMREQGYYITTGIGSDLMEIAENAVRDMIDWLVVDQGEACTRRTRCAASGTSRSARPWTSRTGWPP